MKVLIVDDSEIIREAIGEWIGKFDLEIAGHAGNGKDAVELFSSLQPDIVTLDITMPEMDGLTAMAEMLKINSEAKIVIISALAAKDVALTAIDNGATSFLVKPFTREELEEVFSEILEGD